jgi:protein-S-isoprenylcysteine O-methyltransferase Ste14
MKVWRHLGPVGVAPGVVALVVPAVILYLTGTVDLGWSYSPPTSWLPPLLGCTLIGLGLLLMYKTISLFATVGEGTLAPWDPPRRLVVRGIYRHVRNPMISGVLSILFGETALFGSVALLVWFLVFFAFQVAYMPMIEERGLAKRFGEDYLVYKRNVPRWMPRLTPWVPRFDESYKRTRSRKP